MLPEASSSASRAMSETSVGRAGLHRDFLTGVEPVEDVVVMEDHDGAYYAWKQGGVTNRILVHLDAHLDFEWIADRDPLTLLQAHGLEELERLVRDESRWNLAGRTRERLINLGNYLYPTLSEHLVSAVYWVVPDGFVDNGRQRKALEGVFHRLARKNPRGVQLHGWRDHTLQVTLCGKAVRACRLEDLPGFDEPVLLNVDTDFLVIRSLDEPYPYATPRTRVPWVWPDELVAQLALKKLRTDFVTIAYSVQGGYTPRGLKFLGDELESLLREPDNLERSRSFRQHVREANLAWHHGKLEDAMVAYEQALACAPGRPALHYSLAELTYEKGWTDRARAHYLRAVEADPGYRLTEAGLSPVYQLWGMRDRARASYNMVLALDPLNADAHAGLAVQSASAGDWTCAVSHYEKALAVEPRHPRALVGLGSLCARRRQWHAAEAALTQAVRTTKPEGVAWFWLGVVYAKMSRREEAIAAFEAAARIGFRNFPLHWRLAWLYLRSGRLYRASRQYRRAFRMLPSVPVVLLRRTWIRLRHVAKRTSGCDF